MAASFDEFIAQQSALIAAQDLRERAQREALGRDAALAWERLKALLQGRPGMLPVEIERRVNPGMLPQPYAPQPRPVKPDTDFIPSFIRG